MILTPCDTGRRRWRAVLSCALLAFGSAPAAAQVLPYPATPSYQYGAGDPYGINYNWDYMRYGLPGVGVSPFDPIVQAQLNLGMRTAYYDMLNAWAAQSYQAANLYNQRAIAQAIENQRQLQAVAPRYDVRSRAPRASEAAEAPRPASIPRNDLLSPDGKVLWPGIAPREGDLGKARAAAEAAIFAVAREYKSGGKASVASVVEAKERLFAYGRPALQQVAEKSRADAESLLHFFASLEQLLNALAGV